MALRDRPDYRLARLLDTTVVQKLFNKDDAVHTTRAGKHAFATAVQLIEGVVHQIYVLYNKRPATDTVVVSHQHRSIKITAPQGTQMHLTESQTVAVGMFIDVMLTEWLGEEGRADYPMRSGYPLRLIGMLLKDLNSNITASCLNLQSSRLGSNAAEGWDLLVRGAKMLGFGYFLDDIGTLVAKPIEVIDATDLVGIILDEGEANVSNH